MPRKKTYRTADLPYHVTARCSNKEWFEIPLDKVWEIFSNYLWFISNAYKVRIHAFVLMDNHFHLLIRTPEANIDEAMNYLLREVSKAIGRETGRINQIFGGPYHWTTIKNSIHYQHVYKYIYQNPVQAGICLKVEDYRFSTIRGLLGKDRTIIPAVDNLCLVQDVYKQLQWLNTGFEEEHKTSIKKALRRREFQFPRADRNGAKNFLETHVV